MPGVGECYRALCGAYLGLSKLTNFFALALTSLPPFVQSRKVFSCLRILNPDGYTGSAHHCRGFNDTNLSLVLRVGLYKNHFLTSLRRKVFDRFYHLQSCGAIALTRSTEGFSAPLASLYKALSTLPVCYQTFIRTENSRLLSLGGFSYSVIAY